MRFILTERQLSNILIKENSSKRKSDFLKQFPVDEGITYAGGFDNYVNIVYDGDLSKFSKESGLPLVKFSEGKKALLIHSYLLPKLNLSEMTSIGYFIGKYMSDKFAYNVYISSTPKFTSGYHILCGISGDYGFGFTFLNPSPKRENSKIYEQVINDFDLNKYMK